VQQHRRVEQLGDIAAVGLHDGRDPFPQGLDGLGLPAWAIVADRQ
jgi:hypothetical protein